jgi:hypothetical protein
MCIVFLKYTKEVFYLQEAWHSPNKQVTTDNGVSYAFYILTWQTSLSQSQSVPFLIHDLSPGLLLE